MLSRNGKCRRNTVTVWTRKNPNSGYLIVKLVMMAMTLKNYLQGFLQIQDSKRCAAAAAAAKSLQLWLKYWSDPIDSSPLGSPVPGILQARTLEWVAISFSNAWKWKVKVKSLSRVQLSDPMDCSPPGSSVHGIFQARAPEWGAIALSEVDDDCSLKEL